MKIDKLNFVGKIFTVTVKRGRKNSGALLLEKPAIDLSSCAGGIVAAPSCINQIIKSFYKLNSVINSSSLIQAALRFIP